MFHKDFKIVSGGQSGADRAALDWARRRGFTHGGWCPNGRTAEDGSILPVYRLNETPSHGYLQRTEWNVRDSCGTVIFSVSEILTGGSLATLRFAQNHYKPYLHLHRGLDERDLPVRLLAFIHLNQIKVLNVAGSAAAKEPEIARLVIHTLDVAYRQRSDFLVNHLPAVAWEDMCQRWAKGALTALKNKIARNKQQRIPAG
jgi:hypothetical protein